MKKIIIILLGVLLFCWPGPVLPWSQTTSGITAQNIIDDVRQDINESTASYYDDTADMVYWINEAVHIIASSAGCIEVSEDIILSGGTMAYTLSTSHYDLKSFHLYDSGVVNSPERFSFIRKIQQNLLPDIPEQELRPKYCFEAKGQFCVWPVPGTDISGTTVTVYMSSIPTGVTGVTSQIETPEFFDPAIRNYVRSKAYFKDSREHRGAFFMSLFTSRLQEYIARITGEISAQ